MTNRIMKLLALPMLVSISLSCTKLEEEVLDESSVTGLTEKQIADALGLDESSYQDHLARISEAGMTRLEMLDFDHDEVDSGVEPADDELSRREMAVALSVAIEELPPRLQQVLALYYQEECTLREIGAVLGLGESMVSRLHTEAVHRLRAAIGRE
jgi:RNA polymerase sigma factor for flagellar operon FliA